MGARIRERKPLRTPHGFHRHQREERIQRVERRESRCMLTRIFKTKFASEFLRVYESESN